MLQEAHLKPKCLLKLVFHPASAINEVIIWKHQVNPVSDCDFCKWTRPVTSPVQMNAITVRGQQPSPCQSPLLQTIGRATIASYTAPLTPAHSPSCMCVSKTYGAATQHAKGYFGLSHNTMEVPDRRNKNCGRQWSRICWVKPCNLSYQESHTRR